MGFSILRILFICFVCVACVHAKRGKKQRQAPQNNFAPTSMPTEAFLASCRQYQDTDASVEAIFENGEELQRAFITDMVDIVSESPEVASVDGNKIVGNSLGSSVISVDLPADVPVTTDTVTVSSEPVRLLDLQVTATTDALSHADLTFGDMYNGGFVEFELKQLLQFDGMSAGISVFANFSDGTYSDVTSKATVSSLVPNLLFSEDAYGPLITVDDYSHTQSGHLIEASYPVCVRNDNVTNTGYVELDITPVKVIFHAQFPTLCNVHDLASHFPFSLPDKTYFFISILFKGGYVRNFTDDFLPGINPRAQIHLNNGTDRIAVLKENFIKLTEWASNGTISLGVTFPGLYNITATTYVEVVEYQGTSVTTTTFPSNPGIIKNTVYEADCSQRLQRLQILALGTLSNRVIKDVTFDAKFHISDDNSPVGRMYRVKNFTLFEGYSQGTLYVGAQFGDFLSYWTPIHVLPRGSKSDIVRIESYGRAPNDTMRGFMNSVWTFIRVKTHFADGTYYPEIVNGVTNEWVNVTELVVFNSTNQAAAIIDEVGNVTLKGNFFDKIFLEVKRLPTCEQNADFPVVDESFVYTNLKPVTFDFDMGSTVGPKYGTKLVDAPFGIPIGVQSRPGAPITTFHMILTFDPVVVSVDDDATGCLMDESWTGFFECTTNNPPGEVHIAGICGMQGCEAEDFVKFANIAFTTNGIGRSTISGQIVRSGDADGTVSNLTVTAGTDDVLLQTATPSSQPTGEPSGAPSYSPSTCPSAVPTSIPTTSPTPAPTPTPTVAPTRRPSATPTRSPSRDPTVRPTFTVTDRPTAPPTAIPTVAPTAVPSRKPSNQPTPRPTREPSAIPTRKPTKHPTPEPTREPTSGKPTKAPTLRPSMKPTREPTSARPSRTPTLEPSEQPTEKPTFSPTEEPTIHPTLEPSAYPTVEPTLEPTPLPSCTPTRKPTGRPTMHPTHRPSAAPSVKPTRQPTTYKPTKVPTFAPTSRKPTAKPTKMPTARPTTATPTTARPTTGYPSSLPSATPTSNPTGIPTSIPTSAPTVCPTSRPTSIPTCYPTAHPTPKPTQLPTRVPTTRPIANPTFRPTRFKSPKPTVPDPTYQPTAVPTTQWPTSAPTSTPTVIPTSSPTINPTSHPSPAPTSIPTAIPTCWPTSMPSTPPTVAPSEAPTSHPTSSAPTSYPTHLPTIFTELGYNFTVDCNKPVTGVINIVLRGTEEVCSNLPAFGSISLITSDLMVAASDPNYTVHYSISIIDPLKSEGVRFGETELPQSVFVNSSVSFASLHAPFKYWDVAYDFGDTGETLKGSLHGEEIIDGIGLFQVCLINLDPTNSLIDVHFSGTVAFSQTKYDCDIPLSGYVDSSPPTGSPTSRPSEAPPTSIPTSAPSFGAQKDGINFPALCDDMVYGEIVLRDLPFMREGCGYFPGRGLESMAEIELYFQELHEGANPVHVIVQDLTNLVAYRYGDSFVDISEALDVSELSKNAEFIPFADGMDVGFMMSRKIAMPMNGFDALGGTGWFGVCLINTGYDTNAAMTTAKEFVVTGAITFMDFTVDCFIMFTQPLVAPTRRELNWIEGADAGAPSVGSVPVAVKLSSSARRRQVVNVKNWIEDGDTTRLVEHIKSTTGLFVNDAESYHQPSKQNSLQVLHQLEEEDFENLYANPVSITFEFAPRPQPFVVPAGTTTLTISACGGSGGNTLQNAGGLGGCIKSIVSVVPKQTLFITVGGEGLSHGVSGFHGGGIGSSATLGFASESNNAGGAGGGGASEVRYNDSDISSRIAVAGGGGGAGSAPGAIGGAGGGYVGGTGGLGITSLAGTTIPSLGGGQSGGGLGGSHDGSACGTNDGYLGAGGSSFIGGGGGGGYYGGGGGCYSGGGGGSNFAIGSVVGNLQGVHMGPGFVRLTYNKRLVVREALLPQTRYELGQGQPQFHIMETGTSDSSLAGVGTTDDQLDVFICELCVMGDVNRDCVFDAQDARELQQIIALNLLSLPHEYTTCQLVQMDPNRDGYVNVLDILFLMRVTTKKYRFLHMLEVQYNADIGLMIEADIREPNGTMYRPSHTSVSFSIATVQGPDLELVSGKLEPDVQYPWGVQVTPSRMPDTGLARVHSSFIYNENGMAIAVIIKTYDDFYRTQGDRVYTFYCSPFSNANSMCKSSGIRQDFDGYFEFDITGMPTWQPTRQPTYSHEPTAVPTAVPTTGYPTSYPTLHYVDVTQVLRLIHPVIETLVGPAMPTHDFPALTGRSSWTLPFAINMGLEPEQNSTFALSVAGRHYENITLTGSSRRLAAAVEIVVKTPLVYQDLRSVVVAYQVRDERGDCRVHPSTAMELYVQGQRGSMTVSCSSPDVATGIGGCSGTLPTDWWDASDKLVNVLVREVSTGVAAPGSLYIDKVVFGLPSSTDPYMLLSVPTAPVSPGEIFTATIVCETDGQILNQWVIELDFDPAIVSYVSYDTGSGFKKAFPTVNEGSLRLSSSTGKKSGRRHGRFDILHTVELVEVTFQVQPTAPEGVHDFLRGLVVSCRDVRLPSNSYMQVQDHRDYNDYTEAQLHILGLETKPVGVFAYASHSELLNTASLTGINVLSTITVMGLAAGADLSVADITSSCTCSVRNDSRVVLDLMHNATGSCVVSLSAAAMAGSGAAMVDVDCPQGAASVPFYVWYASSVKTTVLDNVLNIIYPAH